jgi:Bifunctional DNA primase/polymerase, N-terminal/Primase C terminal 1 (PriCT-1)
MPTNPKLAVALWYARRGWRVFAAHTPTRSGCSCPKKTRCSDIGKHPRWDKKLLPHGVLSATTDETLIRSWWKKWPNANVGIATGAGSGIFVLDVDPRHDGLTSLEHLQTEHGSLPETIEGITGGGGNHFVLEHPGAPTHIRNSNGELAPGLDIRGDGGYIIAPPSAHKSGNAYTWKERHSPKDLAPAKPPPWLLTLITKPAPRQEPPAPDQPIPEGQRNSTLFRNGCAMRRRGLGYDAILAALRVENAQRCKPPLPDEDVEKIAQRAAQYAPADSPSPQASHTETTASEEIRQQINALIADLRSHPDLHKLFQAISLLAQLPTEEWSPTKSTLKEIFGKQLNLNDLEEARKAARKKHAQVHRAARAQQLSTDIPAVILNNNRPLRELTADALGHWVTRNTPPTTFVRSGTLTRVRPDEHGRPIIDALGEAHVRGVLTRTMNFYNLFESEEEGVVEVHRPPPLEVVRDILALGQWAMPALEAITELPVLRPDGSILDTPGYDAATCLYYHPDPKLKLPPIPASPTKADALRARDLLWEAIGEFPYVDDGPLNTQNGNTSRVSASRANAMAALLTPVVRHLIDGCVPMGIIDKPKAGTGASLFTKVVSMIGTGRSAAMMAAPHEDDEWRKSIIALLREGATVVIIDNVDHPLWAPSLAMALTTTMIGGRLLGLNENIR